MFSATTLRYVCPGASVHQPKESTITKCSGTLLRNAISLVLINIENKGAEGCRRGGGGFGFPCLARPMLDSVPARI